MVNIELSILKIELAYAQILFSTYKKWFAISHSLTKLRFQSMDHSIITLCIPMFLRLYKTMQGSIDRHPNIEAHFDRSRWLMQWYQYGDNFARCCPSRDSPLKVKKTLTKNFAKIKEKSSR